MGRQADDIQVWAAGINHFQWLLKIYDGTTGEDLYPLLREREKTFDPSFEPFTRRMLNAFSYFPSCSDDHIAEYVPYGWEAGEEGYDFMGRETGMQELKKDVIERINCQKPMDSEWLSSSGERVIQVIAGILNDKREVIESGIVYNRGVISNLPADLAVEVPIMVDAGGVHPLFIGELPGAVAKLIMPQAGAQQMAVEAAAYGSKELALQALLIDPVVNSMTAAEKILEELWEVNKAYIRKCI